MEIFIGALALAALFMVGIVLTMFRIRRREKKLATAFLPLDVPSSSIIPEIGNGFSDGVKNGVRAITQREQRQEEMKNRRLTGLCLYCERQALIAIPQLTLLRPLFDPLYRYLNVVPVNRWKIEVNPGTEVPYALCPIHHAIARSHLERRIAENQVDYAAFVERQRHEMYEFESYALDERMLDDANSVKRGKKQKKAPEVVQLQRPGLKAVNGTGA